MKVKLISLLVLVLGAPFLDCGEQRPEETSQSTAAVTAPSWELMGPFGITSLFSPGQQFAGMVTDIAFDGLTIATTGGVFRRSGGSSAWSSVSDNICTSAADSAGCANRAIRSIAVSPLDQNIILAGTGLFDESFGNAIPSGVYRTANGGQSWTRVLAIAKAGNDIWKIRFEGTNVVHVVASNGYFRSTDAGQTFVPDGGGPILSTGGSLTDFVVDPSNSNFKYTVSWGGGVNGTNGGLWMTSTGGATSAAWAQVAVPGLDRSQIDRSSIALSPSSPSTLYWLAGSHSVDALFNYPNCQIWRVDNHGASVTPLPGPCVIGGAVSRNQAIGVAPRANPSDPDKIIIGVQHAFLSTDGGQTWTYITNDHGVPLHDDFWAIRWTSPTDVYVGTDGGYYESHDAGSTWSAVNNTTPSLHTARIATGPTMDQILGSSWDTGTFFRVNGAWQINEAAACCDRVEAFVDPYHPAQWWWTGALPVSIHRSNDFGQTFGGSPPGIPVSETNQASRQFGIWLRQDHRHDGGNPINVYSNAGGAGIFMTDGSPCASLSDCAGHNPWVNLTSDPGSAGMAFDDLAVGDFNSTTNAATVYSAIMFTSGKRVWVRSESSATPVSYAGPPANVAKFAVLPRRPNIAYAVTFERTSSSGNKSIFKSTNTGQTWTALASAGLPNGMLLTDIVVYPPDSTCLYLASDRGVFRSTDDGANWTDWGTSAGINFGSFVNSLAVSRVVTSGTPYLLAGVWSGGIYRRPLSCASYPKPDFNADGKADIIQHNPGSSAAGTLQAGGISAWAMNGQDRASSTLLTESGTGQIHNVQSPFSFEGVADFDGDGKTDLLVFNSSTRESHVWFMNGTQRTAFAFLTDPGSATHLAPSAGWKIVAVADFDRDGQPDVLWHNPSLNTPNLQVWLMDGDTYPVGGTTRREFLFLTEKSTGAAHIVPSPYEVRGTGDFDRDGQVDLLVFNTSTREAHIWYMDGTARRDFAFILDASGQHLSTGTWEIRGVDDYTGSGVPAIKLHNPTTGNVKIWTLQGAPTNNVFAAEHIVVDTSSGNQNVVAASPSYLVKH